MQYGMTAKQVKLAWMLVCVVCGMACRSDVVSASTPSASQPVLRCRAFDSQTAAQRALFHSPRLFRLDRDRDGLACERLPGPFSGAMSLISIGRVLSGELVVPKRSGCIQARRVQIFLRLSGRDRRLGSAIARPGLLLDGRSENVFAFHRRLGVMGTHSVYAVSRGFRGRDGDICSRFRSRLAS